MKYDHDKMRKILLEIEKADYDGYPLDAVSGMGDRDFRFHARLLYEAGYIHAVDLSNRNSLDGIYYQPTMLTYKGVEFLEAVRSDNGWERIKGKAVDVGGGYGLWVLERVAKYFVSGQLPL